MSHTSTPLLLIIITRFVNNYCFCENASLKVLQFWKDNPLVLEVPCTVIMHSKRFASLLYFIFCVSGFLIQVQQVSEFYFRYQTTSKIEIVVKEMEPYPNLMYCPRYVDLLDRSNHKKYGLYPEPVITNEGLFAEMSLLTVKQILELTPSSNLIRECTVRSNTTFTAINRNSSECEKLFTVTKSVNGERICYTFTTRDSSSYSISGVATSATHTGNVYTLLLSSPVAKTISAHVISPSELDTHKDSLYSRHFAGKVSNLDTFTKSLIVVYVESTEISRLSPPYDTKCTPSHDKEKCYEDCLTGKFKAINRTTWSGFHRDLIDMKMFSPLDFHSETMNTVAENAIRDCSQKCKVKKDCFTKFSKTSVQENKASTFCILIKVPSAPHTSIYSVPYMTPVEYIIQVGSCFGVWFGLSIISFNPVKWKLFWKNKRAALHAHAARKITFLKARV